MSAAVPTTHKPFRWTDLPEGIRDGGVFDCLDPETLHSVQRVSKRGHQETEGHYLRRIDSTVQAAILSQTQSQTEEGASQQDRLPKRRRRAIRLLEGAGKLVGGSKRVRDATQNGAISRIHPEVLRDVADGQYFCKVVGMIPILKVISGGTNVLEAIKQVDSNRDKYQAVKAWMQEHKGQVESVREVTITNCRYSDISEYISGNFLALRGKVYNLLPRAIGMLKGLTKLNVCNNLLVSVPRQLKGVPLEELDLSNNKLSKMPHAIKTVRKLNLERNGTFQFDDIERYIRSLIQEGGTYQQIFMDLSYSALPQFTKLCSEIEEEGSYTLSVERVDGSTKITILETIPDTLPLEEF